MKMNTLLALLLSSSTLSLLPCDCLKPLLVCFKRVTRNEPKKATAVTYKLLKNSVPKRKEAKKQQSLKKQPKKLKINLELTLPIPPRSQSRRFTFNPNDLYGLKGLTPIKPK